MYNYAICEVQCKKYKGVLIASNIGTKLKTEKVQQTIRLMFTSNQKS